MGCRPSFSAVFQSIFRANGSQAWSKMVASCPRHFAFSLGLFLSYHILKIFFTLHRFELKCDTPFHFDKYSECAMHVRLDQNTNSQLGVSFLVSDDNTK